MRLMALRKYSTRRVVVRPLLDGFDAALVVVALVAVYALVGYVAENGELSDQAARAVARADRAEMTRAACMRELAINPHPDAFVVCAKEKS